PKQGPVPQPANPSNAALERLWIPLCLLNAILGRKSFNVVTFKGGKAIGKSKFGVPVRYAAQQSIDTTPVATGSSLNICRGFSPDQEDRCVSFLFAKKRRAADALTAVQGNSYAKTISIQLMQEVDLCTTGKFGR
ncbi:unnamed protein product, partial [Pocillopora meandrina]